MPNQIQDNLFRAYANRIVGYWYNFLEKEFIILSLPKGLETSASFIIKSDRSYEEATYSLHFHSDNEPYIVIKKPTETIEATIKILTGDTLLLQMDNNLKIYERQVDYDFANQVIGSL